MVFKVLLVLLYLSHARLIPVAHTDEFSTKTDAPRSHATPPEYTDNGQNDFSYLGVLSSVLGRSKHVGLGYGLSGHLFQFCDLL